MNDMIKAEREKILSRKQTKILFITGVILIIAVDCKMKLDT